MKKNGPNKAESRLRMKMLLAALREDRGSFERRSIAICRAIEGHPGWLSARIAGAFLPLASEPQIHPLWERTDGPGWCFPRLRSDRIEMVRIDDRETLRRADWKLALPEFDAAVLVPVAEIDMLLVPGLAFSRSGARLGRGGGHYDRLLMEKAPRTVVLGVCFEIQLVEEIPWEEHDRAVDAIVTESGVIVA
jgi:5-formyltetrahydrofolate cyclo-ligase